MFLGRFLLWSSFCPQEFNRRQEAVSRRQEAGAGAGVGVAVSWAIGKNFVSYSCPCLLLLSPDLAGCSFSSQFGRRRLTQVAAGAPGLRDGGDRVFEDQLIV